jgi:hypothetical protein
MKRYAMLGLVSVLALAGVACGDDGGNTNNQNQVTGPCADQPCQNGGTCNDDGVGGYTCTCVAGFQGTQCETNIDDCAINPCLNGGTCVDGIDSFSCTCVTGWTGSTCQTPVATDPQPALGDAVSIVFLHHSTGGVVWDGGVADWFTTHTITAPDYPAAPYPWQNYPYDYWHLWVEGGGMAASEGVPTLETLTAENPVVVFKHCFPVAGMVADDGSPDIASQAKTRANYELQYEALKARLLSFPDNRFIVWTGAALRESETSIEAATLARDFFQWVKDVWDEPGDNIYVWDFWQLETAGGLYLTVDNASGDSHPNGTFAQAVAPLFSQRIIDVIDGYGDLRSLTGE